jgi:uncharacterized protein YdhG (YjbR/CyaY superfamily)
MTSSKASTVAEYLDALPEDRRAALTAVCDVVRANLPEGYVEAMQYGMPSWVVPLDRYPETYNGQPLAIASLASQKQSMSLYLMGVYGDAALQTWFVERYRESGKKLDMGKSCVRFKRLEDLPLALIGETIAKVPVDAFLATYEASRASVASASKAKKPASKKTSSARNR